MKKKTLNKRLGAALIAAFCLSSGMTAFAAPEAMPNGSIFDAEYYAKNNPDVVAALGTEKDALFNHYVMFGWNEGRLAFEGDTPHSSNLTITQEQQPQQQIPEGGVVKTAPNGETYIVMPDGSHIYENYTTYPDGRTVYKDGTVIQMMPRKDYSKYIVPPNLQPGQSYDPATGRIWQPGDDVGGGTYLGDVHDIKLDF